MEAGLTEIIGYLVTGAIAGTLGGLLGIGGGVVMVPAVNLIFGKHIQLAVASSLFCMIFLSISSAYGHWKNGYILKNVLWEMAPIATVSAIVGVFLGSWVLPVWVLHLLFATFLAYTAYKNIATVVRRTPEEGPIKRFVLPNRWIVPVIAVPMGLSCGILGIGGGVVAVPALHYFLKLPFKNAVANSSATILFSAAVAAVVKLSTINGMEVTTAGGTATLYWYHAVIIGALMAPTALVFGRIGSHLTRISPTRLVRALFVVVAVWACWKYADKTRQDLQAYLDSRAPTAVGEDVEVRRTAGLWPGPRERT